MTFMTVGGPQGHGHSLGCECPRLSGRLSTLARMTLVARPPLSIRDGEPGRPFKVSLSLEIRLHFTPIGEVKTSDFPPIARGPIRSQIDYIPIPVSSIPSCYVEPKFLCNALMVSADYEGIFDGRYRNVPLGTWTDLIDLSIKLGQLIERRRCWYEKF